MFKSLYTRIAIYTIVVLLFSAIMSFLITNVYYHLYLKEKNDAKIMRTLKEAKNYQSESNVTSLDQYFTHMGEMNYQVMTVTTSGKKSFYGTPFREDNISQSAVQQVLADKPFHGIKNQPFQPFITGFFENVTSNTVGVPFHSDGKKVAVFMRPDIGQTFSEFRIFLALLITLLLVISITLVILSTNAIVKPIQQLKRSTERMMHGDFDTPTEITRKDELGTLQYRFDTMRQSLKQLDDMRQHFVQNVSHEIKTPLTHIHHLLDKMKHAKTTTAQHQYIDDIYQITTQLSDLTKALLLLSELDNNVHLKFNDAIQINQLLTEIIRHEQYSANEKDLIILSDFEAVSYTGNRRLLHQAFQNLITNAIKYSPKDGAIDIILHQDSEYITFMIQNEGEPMSQMTQQHIFERFYKISEYDNSNGLGLAIVKTIVELHQGQVTVDSTYEKGTVFTIKLPSDNNN
ncbi:HAMP domain-containing sensor histidine kinase [Staphylococcus arlettae]|uniref:HAMP domain-containing sensor histidine kinase n=1 Tax=Staphylococcus arlettae TaxID=29378 RepID=UPI003BA1F6A4